MRLGVGNQRVVVRTLRLPAIEDPKEMEAAVRFQAQEQIPMPLDQAVLEHQVVGGVPAEEGAAPQVDVVVVAARRDMVASLLEPLRRAGLEPVGVDLSAFGMIRALAAVRRRQPAEPPTAAPAQPAEAVLYCNVGDVMNLAVARGRACLFTRVSQSASRRSPAGSPASAGSAPNTPTSGSPTSGSRRRSRQIEGDPEIVAEPGGRSRRGSRRWSTSCASRSTTTAPRRARCRSTRIVLCGPGSAIPGLAARMEERPRPADRRRPPAGARRATTTAPAARLTLPYGLALES